MTLHGLILLIKQQHMSIKLLLHLSKSKNHSCHFEFQLLGVVFGVIGYGLVFLVKNVDGIVEVRTWSQLSGYQEVREAGEG